MPSLACAVELCRRIEAVCPQYGYHVALTGGCLYKDGERKDMDILFYRIRQVANSECRPREMFDHLVELGIISEYSGFGWLIKARRFDHTVLKGEYTIDCFFPEEIEGGDYAG